MRAVRNPLVDEHTQLRQVKRQHHQRGCDADKDQEDPGPGNMHTVGLSRLSLRGPYPLKTECHGPAAADKLGLPKSKRRAILPETTTLEAVVWSKGKDSRPRPLRYPTLVPAIAQFSENSPMCGVKSLVIAAALLVPAVLVPRAEAQVTITFGAPPPCPYGYYGYAPYSCAPVGYYGPGYFYNGIFLGVGPWAYWGYNHGWGGYRFRGPGGGHYYPHSGYYPGHPPKGGYPRYHLPPNYGGKPPYHGSHPPNNGGKPPYNGGGKPPNNGGKPPNNGGGGHNGGGKPPSGGGGGGKPPNNGGGGGKPPSGGGGGKPPSGGGGGGGGGNPR